MLLLRGGRIERKESHEPLLGLGVPSGSRDRSIRGTTGPVGCGFAREGNGERGRGCGWFLEWWMKACMKEEEEKSRAIGWHLG